MIEYEYDLTPYQNRVEDIISNYQIKVKHVKVEPTDPPFAYPNKNTIIMNDMYDSSVSPIFILAHEIYHIINDSNDQHIYAFSPLAKITEEKNAHKFAIRLLMESFDDDYVPNYIAVMYALGLPLSMEYLIKQEWLALHSRLTLN